MYQVNACLSPELKTAESPERVLFGNVDGTGTHTEKLIATHLAISEAIERWAWEQTAEGPEAAKYGFDVDATTTGMAAFPGLFARQTRSYALREAVERWCLREWWAGHLPCSRMENRNGNQKLLRLGNPLTRHKVVISWSVGESGLVGYGVGCGRRLANAILRASIEQQRASHALEAFNAKQQQTISKRLLADIDGYAERSFLYYSLPSGHAEFAQCVDHSAIKEDVLDPATGRQRIRPLVDTGIPGPWSEYAHVWRVLYPLSRNQPTTEYSFYA